MQPSATNPETSVANDLGDSSLRVPRSAFRAFTVLVVQSFQRHWRVRQMGWVAVGLLSIAVIWVAAVTLSPAGWGLENRRVRRTQVTYREYGERFPDLVQWFLDLGSGEPQTLCHGDFRLDNLFFAATDDLTPAGIESAAALALEIARAGAAARTHDIALAPEARYEAVWTSTVTPVVSSMDSFSVRAT